MHRTVVLNVVGLSPRHIGPDTPALAKLARAGATRALQTITPAVTCAAQATLVTGALPREHGIVANGWYFRDLAEVWFWRQSNHLVGGEKLWDAARARDPAFTCAKMFWWYNMYANVDYAVTPRPQYLADGRKLPDIHSHPAALRDDLQAALGQFPLFNFWGPNANIVSTRWIADAARRVFDEQAPSLTLVYLPHLDYVLQKAGPEDPSVASHLRELDAVCGALIEHVQSRGARVIVHSEYGITPVSGPVHINRALRRAGLLHVRDERGHELLDAGASDAFAVSDHQLAHVYVRDPARVPEVRALLAELDGVDRVLDAEGKAAFGLDHARSGELVALAKPDRWFTYYYFLEDARAPDFARCVEIHRKPGYDPVELFLDPELPLPMAQVALRLAKKKLGFRTLMDLIPLDASLVRGSHGRLTARPEDGPVCMSSEARLMPEGDVVATDFKQLVLSHLFDA